MRPFCSHRHGKATQATWVTATGTGAIVQSTTKYYALLLRTTKCYIATTPYYLLRTSLNYEALHTTTLNHKVLLRTTDCYIVLRALLGTTSITPILLRTTTCYSSTKVLPKSYIDTLLASPAGDSLHLIGTFGLHHSIGPNAYMNAIFEPVVKNSKAWPRPVGADFFQNLRFAIYSYLASLAP